ncbi:phosphopantetheine-binding protein [Flavobacteriales bacterium]|nr:phosphopantetheine-binding protein [Flavobacteriales bacterium]
MDKQQIIDTVNEFLMEEFEADAADIEADASMHEALDLDSLDYVDLVVLIDENFGFKTTNEDFQSITTFDDFYNFIASKVNA